MITIRDMFRRSREHDSIPELIMINDLLPTPLKFPCVLLLGPVSVECPLMGTKQLTCNYICLANSQNALEENKITDHVRTS